MVVIKTEEEISKLRDANLIVADVLEMLEEQISDGITTYDVDKIASCESKKRGAIPAFKGYRGFPANICTSINCEVVHGIPSKERKLVNGDIVGIDFGVLYNGYYGDAAKTFKIGRISADAEKLINVTYEALYKGIGKATPNHYLGDISHAIESHVKAHGFSVVREFVGHGIGKKMHEEPVIPNFGKPNTGIRLQKGMVFAIEPMVNVGKSDVKVLADGWTAVTSDGCLSAHFEHSVAITDEKPFILSEK